MPSNGYADPSGAAPYTAAWFAAHPGSGAQNGGGGGGSGIDLASEREKILGIFQNDQNFYNNPAQMALQGQIMGRSSGQDSPFSRSVLESMFSQNAQGANGMFGSERDQIMQTMANSGLGGSGAQMSALTQARTRAQQQMRAGRRDITSRAALENFGARERAQQQAQSFFAQRAAHQQQGALAEAGFRSQATQQDERPGTAAAGPQLLGSGAVHDQAQWDRKINELIQRMSDSQQAGITGASAGDVQAAPVAAPNPYQGGFRYGGASTYTSGGGGSTGASAPLPGYGTQVPNSPSTGGGFPSTGGWAYQNSGPTNYVNRSY